MSATSVDPQVSRSEGGGRRKARPHPPFSSSPSLSPPAPPNSSPALPSWLSTNPPSGTTRFFMDAGNALLLPPTRLDRSQASQGRTMGDVVQPVRGKQWTQPGVQRRSSLSLPFGRTAWLSRLSFPSSSSSFLQAFVKYGPWPLKGGPAPTFDFWLLLALPCRAAFGAARDCFGGLAWCFGGPLNVRI